MMYVILFVSCDSMLCPWHGGGKHKGKTRAHGDVCASCAINDDNHFHIDSGSS